MDLLDELGINIKLAFRPTAQLPGYLVGDYGYPYKLAI